MLLAPARPRALSKTEENGDRVITGWRLPRASPILLGIAASAMVVTVLLPAELWKTPESDGSYSGFDPVVMYMNPTGEGREAGTIEIDEGSMTISAVPGSAPVVHLATSPLSYSSSFRVTVREAQGDSEPFYVAAWAPYQNLQYRLVFEPEPSTSRTPSGSTPGRGS